MILAFLSPKSVSASMFQPWLDPRTVCMKWYCFIILLDHICACKLYWIEVFSYKTWLRVVQETCFFYLEITFDICENLLCSWKWINDEKSVCSFLFLKLEWGGVCLCVRNEGSGADCCRACNNQVIAMIWESGRRMKFTFIFFLNISFHLFSVHTIRKRGEPIFKPCSRKLVRQHITPC